MPKSPDAFRTISEVADWLGIQAHVLRFWESKFTQIKPVKRAGGRRYYRPADMQLIGGIKKLLHDDGLAIKDVQQILKDQGIAHVSSLSPSLDDEVNPSPAAARPLPGPGEIQLDAPAPAMEPAAPEEPVDMPQASQVMEVLGSADPEDDEAEDALQRAAPANTAEAPAAADVFEEPAAEVFEPATGAAPAAEPFHDPEPESAEAMEIDTAEAPAAEPEAQELTPAPEPEDVAPAAQEELDFQTPMDFSAADAAPAAPLEEEAAEPAPAEAAELPADPAPAAQPAQRGTVLSRLPGLTAIPAPVRGEVEACAAELRAWLERR